MATKLDKIRANIQSMENLEIDREFIGMLYGGPGAGKTVLAMMLAQAIRAAYGGDILYLDTADGWVSLGEDEWEPLREGVDRFQISEAADLPAITQALKQRASGFENYRVLVIDEFSSLAQSTLEDVTREATGAKRDDLLPEIEGKFYGTMTQLMVSILRNLKRVEGLHIVLVSHAREKTDRTQVTRIAPELSPLLLNSASKLMHVTAYLSNAITERKGQPVYTRTVQSWPTALIQAKSRISLPVRTDPETWLDAIYNWVVGSLAEDGTPTEVDLPDDAVADDVVETDGLEPPDEDVADDEPVYVEEG